MAEYFFAQMLFKACHIYVFMLQHNSTAWYSLHFGKQEVAVRLSGGNNVTSGRVEVKYKGVWGTVCDDNFGPEEGRVLCRMFGFPGGVKTFPEAAFGPGSGPIWVNNILCHGNESRLTECPAPAWGPSYQCKHLEDVGVECLLKGIVSRDFLLPVFFFS
jgi:hypothetical protein